MSASDRGRHLSVGLSGSQRYRKRQHNASLENPKRYAYVSSKTKSVLNRKMWMCLTHSFKQHPTHDAHEGFSLEGLSTLHFQLNLSCMKCLVARLAERGTRMNIPRCLYIPIQRSSPSKEGSLRLVNQGFFRPLPLGRGY